ncbi:hypothetical protein MTO96_051638, partial [Rhipicephalus appendiculatus]
LHGGIYVVGCERSYTECHVQALETPEWKHGAHL